MLGWIDTIIQGVLLGGLYSLYATGLSVIFGIMRLVNLAHGDLIVLGAFLIASSLERNTIPTFLTLRALRLCPVVRVRWSWDRKVGRR